VLWRDNFYEQSSAAEDIGVTLQISLTDALRRDLLTLMPIAWMWPANTLSPISATTEEDSLGLCYVNIDSTEF
jgi:hypothetical protein